MYNWPPAAPEKEDKITFVTSNPTKPVLLGMYRQKNKQI
jgi:hypothetical protein